MLTLMVCDVEQLPVIDIPLPLFPLLALQLTDVVPWES